ncbi:YicC/YloC family endoribonuclease [Caldisalinibacter kiritimatiensis]|uniref:Protein YicC n=1 Tax=Caldisalinibacter kiritimatiensis TaxID=1304284 RepID=R1AXB8_9FIRM|nr:YicC/YloC family endoribonuclease [Caldisalinibacter kiritimatiensis]EOD01307.1 Protein YicC [Caldisalinibacter kiritimatiensis]
MIRSMTGFGKGESKDSVRHFTVEVRSVNNRYNDIIIRMPKHLKYIEDRIKKLIKTKVSRGRVEVYINLEYIGDSDVTVKVDLNLAESYNKALKELCNHTGIKDNVTLSVLTKFPDIINTEKKEEDADEVWNCLKMALEEALDKMIAMRIKEGEELAKDISEKVVDIEDMVSFIEQRSPQVVNEYKEKLWNRIDELLEDKYEIDENRLANEVAIFADKSDINEEVVRLYSHMKQLIDTLKLNGPVGRKLDFLLQEANREVNTIGSKVGDVDIKKKVIEIKSELEKIREQVQNIE